MAGASDIDFSVNVEYDVGSGLSKYCGKCGKILDESDKYIKRVIQYIRDGRLDCLRYDSEENVIANCEVCCKIEKMRNCNGKGYINSKSCVNCVMPMMLINDIRHIVGCSTEEVYNLFNIDGRYRSSYMLYNTIEHFVKKSTECAIRDYMGFEMGRDIYRKRWEFDIKETLSGRKYLTIKTVPFAIDITKKEALQINQ